MDAVPNKPIDGILLVDKPVDFTSYDIVRMLKGRLKCSKIGHAGTLDPAATGLLIVLIGKATKMSDALMASDKEYSGVIRLGQSTDSYDLAGSVVETLPCGHISIDDIVSAANSFIGSQLQTAPMFSAKKVEGVPLYKLARKGKSVERKQHSVDIHEFKIVKFENPDIYFSIICSKGTYIRSIANDIGLRLGCCAHLAELRRMRSGKFSVANALCGGAIKHMTKEGILPNVIDAIDL